jgi:SnoaL-like domain
MSGDAKMLVEQANAAFYRALESSVLERMEEVWAHEDWVRCVHPGWEMIVGWPRVRESWEMIFEGGQRMRASPSEVWVQIRDDMAWVTCLENITVFGESSFDSAQAAATNLFMRRDDRWLMVHHHASPIPMIVPDASSDVIQ